MKTIIIVIPSLNLGGAEKVSVNLANELVRRRLKVVIVVFKAGGNFHAELSPKIKIVSFHSDKAFPSLLPRKC